RSFASLRMTFRRLARAQEVHESSEPTLGLLWLRGRHALPRPEHKRDVSDSESATLGEGALGGDPVAVHERAVTGPLVGDVPRLSLEEQRSVRGRDAGVGESQVVRTGAADRAHRAFD